jgi:hypothetical protein
VQTFGCKNFGAKKWREKIGANILAGKKLAGKFWREKIGAKKFGGKKFGGKKLARKYWRKKNLAGKWENFMTLSLLVGMKKLECLFLASLIRLVIYLQVSEGAYPLIRSPLNN